MINTPANPFLVGLLFLLRCLIPLLLLVGVSYLLRKLGLVAGTEGEPSRGGKSGKKPSAKNRRTGA